MRSFRNSLIEGLLCVRSVAGPRTDYCSKNQIYEADQGDLRGGSVDKNLPARAGDTGLIPGPGRPHRPQSS